MASKKTLIRALSNPNVRKFLDLLAYTEGTQGNGYYTAFGGGRLHSLADHPRYLKSFRQTNGKSNKTSAAGRYQFVRKTWDSLAKQYGFKNFGARNQDLGAVALLAQNGALPYILKGDFNRAVAKSGKTWASLPSSHYKQGKKSWRKVQAFLGGQQMSNQPMRASYNNNWLVYQNKGKIRNKPLSRKLVRSLSFLGDMGITMKVASGGQSATGKRRTGSHRHDYGNAGDVDFYKNGRKLSFNNRNDRAILQEIVQRAKTNGVTGFGAGHGYMGDGRMHIGFGKPAVWGEGGKGANAPSWLRQAFNSKQRLQPLDNKFQTPRVEEFTLEQIKAMGKPQQQPKEFSLEEIQNMGKSQEPQVKEYSLEEIQAMGNPQQQQSPIITEQPIQQTSEFNTFGAISNELPKLKEQGLNPYQALYSLAQRDDEIGQSIKMAYQKGMNSEQLTNILGVNQIWQTQQNSLNKQSNKELPMGVKMENPIMQSLSV